MFDSATLAQQLSASVSKYLIAYSGGLDSHVLLHSMASLAAQSGFKIRAAHIHHGLSNNADSWVEHCKQICAELEVELLTAKVAVQEQCAGKHSMEAVARELRYQKLADFLQEGEVLVTAHHMDDQAETLLLQLFRGAGVDGLAAMPASREFAASFLLRPLLTFSRAELLVYAQFHKLNWIEDESNENIGIDRNYVRHSLLPTIEARWPNVLKTLNRTASNCAESSELQELVAAQDHQECCVADMLEIAKLLNLSVARQSNLIRYWLREKGLSIPSHIKLQHIVHDVLLAREDAMPCVSWHGGEVRRYQNRLYAMLPLVLHDSAVATDWDGKSEIILPNDMGVVKPELLGELGLDLDKITNLAIRFRHNGIPSGFKKKLQALRIPPWLRDRVPLLSYTEKETGKESFIILSAMIG